ncbi:glycosyltransferase [Paraburkholderia sp. C35]|uniref:glycosyltransferase n=1 Tax=Paraburkholderia sp. C35 TaxID=2126993 RepID=UPI000D68FE7F|nr:glycosyltransferase [Paraburkholderia sp. C35]
MRVAYVVNQYPKVSHSFIRREILALEKLGVNVARFALRGWKDDLVDASDVSERERTEYLLRDGVLPLLSALVLQIVLNSSRFLRALGQTLRMIHRTDRTLALHAITLAEACYLARRMRGRDITHMHAHFGTNSTEVAMLASTLTDIPYSFTVHGPDEFDKPEFIKLALKVRHARFVVAISDFCASQIYRWSAYQDWKKVAIVRCGIDPDFGAAAYIPPQSPQRLVCIGRLAPQKGHMLLVQAAARASRDIADLEITLIGDGEMRGEIESLTQSEGLTSTIRFVGWKDTEGVRRELVSARGLVLASFAEGLPIVIMEAMSLGRAVIAADIAAIPELVQTGETGWLFSPGSMESLSSAITQCLSTTEADHVAMGERARKVIQQRHDQDREASVLAKLFSGQVTVANLRGAQ